MARWGCQDCPALFGAWLSRCPRCGSAKELKMALRVCASCTTKFAVGLTSCPHCRSTEYVEDGDPMAKITRNGGVSDTTLPAEEDAAAAESEPAPPAAADHTEAPDVTEHEAGPAQPFEVRGEHGPELAETEQSETPPPGPDYEAWTVEQLKDELDTRGLPKTGKKDDLVLRLLEDDDTRGTAEKDAE